MQSLPSRERGLKSGSRVNLSQHALVAPFAGAWIEMDMLPDFSQSIFVAPFAGAWIEIFQTVGYLFRKVVAPFAGAWIEITVSQGSLPGLSRRSLRGSVD